MDLVGLLTQWGVPLVFAAVLLEQSDLPVPARAGPDGGADAIELLCR